MYEMRPSVFEFFSRLDDYCYALGGHDLRVAFDPVGQRPPAHGSFSLTFAQP
jgi:hypothetical protein